MTSSNGNIFALLAICAGNSPVPGEFPAQRPVTRSFDVFFDLHPNKRLSKQWWGWWFEKPSRPLWLHRNVFATYSWIWNLFNNAYLEYCNIVFWCSVFSRFSLNYYAIWMLQSILCNAFLPYNHRWYMYFRRSVKCNRPFNIHWECLPSWPTSNTKQSAVGYFCFMSGVNKLGVILVPTGLTQMYFS